MSKCGPVHDQSWRASSELPIQSPLRVPTSRTVLFPVAASIATLSSRIPNRNTSLGASWVKTSSGTFRSPRSPCWACSPSGTASPATSSKQRADRTLRFYWVSPAMSQVYSELERLHARGLVRRDGAGRGTAYSLTTEGREALDHWLADTPVGFPVLKHPVALRLLLGALVDPERTTAMLHAHLAALAEEREALEQVHLSLRGADAPGQPFRYPALVADWGLSYFDHERTIIEDLIRRIADGT